LAEEDKTGKAEENSKKPTGNYDKPMQLYEVYE